MKVQEREAKKYVSDVVGCLHDPIICYPGGWGNSLPDWMPAQIQLERLAMELKVLKGATPMATDAEACAYLSTASLDHPLDSDWCDIFLFVSTRTMRLRGIEPPKDIAVDSISEYQAGKLNHLKVWIYEHRSRARQEEERAERRAVKAAAPPAEPKAVPVKFALFEFTKKGEEVHGGK